MTNKFVTKTFCLIVTTLLLIAVAAFPATAYATEVVNPSQSPRMITVSLYGDTKTQMAFTWNTVQYAGSDVLIVEKSATGGFQSHSVITASGTTTKSTVQGDGYVHRVVASNLKPATEYVYKVGDVELNNWSEQGSFTTSGKSAFTFLHVSDPQAYESLYYENYGRMLSSASQLYNFAFVALTGDIVNNSWEGRTPQLEQWDWALTDRFDFMGHTPVAAVAGNHEAATDDFYSRFTYDVPEGSDTSTGCYYSFNYGNAHFTCINTNDTTNKASSDAPGLSENQYNWIKADLAASSNAQWKIVLMHKGIYDSGDHSQNADTGDGREDYDIEKIRLQLAPLFTEYGVDLVLQGHDHLYSKSAPIVAKIQGGELTETADEQPQMRKIGSSQVETYLSPRGTTYLNSGSASGSKYYTPNSGYNPNLIVKTNNPNTLMYTAITVDGNSLLVSTYTMDNDFNSVHYYSFAILHEGVAGGGLLAWQIALIVVGATLSAAGIVTCAIVLAKKSKRKNNSTVA